MPSFRNRIWLIISLIVLVSGLLACTNTSPTNTDTTNSSSNADTSNNSVAPDSTPTLDQVIQNSGNYDCCAVDNNVSSVEATETNDGKILVLATVVNLSWPQDPVNVGQALIFQYMAAIWTSYYQPQSVSVTIMFQGNPDGVIVATLFQETEKGTQWDKADPFDYWNVYDSTDISQSLQSH